MAKRAIFFYEHRYLRDRHIDTVREWPADDEVLNRSHFLARQGSHVSRDQSLSNRSKRSWKQILPLINLKLRPAGIPPDAVVYVWGGQILSGPQIVEIDNPFALTGFNYRAFMWYRPLLRGLLLRKSVLEIRCMSEACLGTLRLLLGEAVAKKARVSYPIVHRMERGTPALRKTDPVELLFVGSQFEIKGGVPLLKAFHRLAKTHSRARLTLITHLPSEYASLADHPSIRIVNRLIPRDELKREFLAKSHVLVHPTLQDSFGLVVLEAISCGCAIIATRVYAIPEMVVEGKNGLLIEPPISQWNGYHPTSHLRNWHRFKAIARRTEMAKFEDDLFTAMNELLQDSRLLASFQEASYSLFDSRFVARRPSLDISATGGQV